MTNSVTNGPTVVARQIPADSSLWDVLDAVENATDAAENQESGVIRITHGPLTRATAGESDVAFAAVDELAGLGMVVVGGEDGCPEVTLTDRGRYHLGKWRKAVRRAQR